VSDLAREGKTILFVGTKRQAQEAIAEEATRCGMFYVNHRWLGGLLTNNATIQKSIQRLRELDDMSRDGRYDLLTKKEVQRLERERKHLEQNLAGIKEMSGMPDVLFVVDSHNEEIAVKEARKLGIPVVAIVDTNCDPDLVNYVIPGNDDALRAIRLFTSRIADAILEGRQAAEDKRLEEEKAAAEKAAEELEKQRLAEAIAAGEIPRPEYTGEEEALAVEGGEGQSAAVLAAEEDADGRVRVPKLKRKPGEFKPRGRRPEEGKEPTPDLS
jgi:small subunit ribosomal protein S2